MPLIGNLTRTDLINRAERIEQFIALVVEAILAEGSDLNWLLDYWQAELADTRRQLEEAQ